MSAFRASLADAYVNHVAVSNPCIEDEWASFKSAIQEASDNLPPLPKKEADWITDEVKNLSRKNKGAWLHLRDISSSDDQRHPNTLAEYRRLRRLTKLAAEKARNTRWSAKATEAKNKEKKVTATRLWWKFSLRLELKLLRNQASKPSSSNILSKDKSKLSMTLTSFNVEHNILQKCQLLLIGLSAGH